jgi:hypothetical protein
VDAPEGLSPSKSSLGGDRDPKASVCLCPVADTASLFQELGCRGRGSPPKRAASTKHPLTLVLHHPTPLRRLARRREVTTASQHPASTGLTGRPSANRSQHQSLAPLKTRPPRRTLTDRTEATVCTPASRTKDLHQSPARTSSLAGLKISAGYGFRPSHP